jgi:hypothetical protein
LGKAEKNYAFSLPIKTALITPSLPGREVTLAKPRLVSISAPLVITPLRL